MLDFKLSFIELILSAASWAFFVISSDLCIHETKAEINPDTIRDIPIVNVAFNAVVATVNPMVLAVEAINDNPYPERLAFAPFNPVKYEPNLVFVAPTAVANACCSF